MTGNCWRSFDCPFSVQQFHSDLAHLQVESSIQIEGMNGVVHFQFWGTRMYRDRMFQAQEKMKHAVKFLVARV